MALDIARVKETLLQHPRMQRLAVDGVYARFIARVMYYSMVRLGDKKPNSVAMHIEHWAEQTPRAPALYFEDRRYSYREFNQEANRVASSLQRAGAVVDQSVALLMDNRPEFLFTIVGANKLGMATGLINTTLSGDALVHAFSITKADWIVVGNEHAERVAEVADQLAVPAERILVWPEPGDEMTEAAPEGARDFGVMLESGSPANPGLDVHDPKRPFLYICTSGTTGLPKAALIRNQRYLRAVYFFGQGVLEVKPDDVTYTCGMPLYHNAGISQGWGVALTGGAACAIRRKFSVSKFWDDVERYNVTLFSYIGEICRYLLSAPPHPLEREHRLRGMIGAGLRPDIWEDFVDRFAIPQVFEYYGATEGNVGLVNLVNKPGVVGRMMSGQVLVRVDPDTEEFVHDEHGHLIPAQVGESGIMLGKIRAMADFDGYVDSSRNASKLVENPFGKGDRYFNTGDLLTLHEQGFVSFADRLGDTFRWKGENVSTNDVQESLLKHPEVVEASVYGVQIPGQEGRAGAAALVVTDDFKPAAFTSFVNEELPFYARPLFIRLEEELPMTGSYKYVKTGFKRDGYDLAAVKTPIYFLHPDKGYVKLTKKLADEINKGAIRV